MRLKEIKPGMVIHCKTQEEANVLCDNFGASQEWKDYWCSYESDTCYEISMNNKIICFGKVGSFSGRCMSEFSDLILPELTAEEVVPILTEICNRYNGNEDCEGCPLNGLENICNGNECPFTFKDYKQVIEICAQWKADHEKKEPEIETVDICRIIEIQPDGRKRCVHEEDLASGSTDAEIKIMVEAELKRYCMEHDGEFIAVHEVVSRVKEV